VYTIRNHIEVVEDLSFIRGRDVRGGLLAAGHAENLCGATVCQTLLEKKGRDQRIAEAGSSLVVTGVMMMMRIFSEIDVMAPVDTAVYLAGCIHRGAVAVRMIASVQAEDTGLPPHSVVVDWRLGRLCAGFPR
jgi:hypothetical protein